MLLDSRGHLKLTDLGLCKKVGEISASDEPEQVLAALLKSQATIVEQPTRRADSVPSSPVVKTEIRKTHRSQSDAMAMSIDEVMQSQQAAAAAAAVVTAGAPPPPPLLQQQQRDPKVRREMAYSTVGTPGTVAFDSLVFCSFYTSLT